MSREEIILIAFSILPALLTTIAVIRTVRIARSERLARAGDPAILRLRDQYATGKIELDEFEDRVAIHLELHPGPAEKIAYAAPPAQVSKLPVPEAKQFCSYAATWCSCSPGNRCGKAADAAYVSQTEIDTVLARVASAYRVPPHYPAHLHTAPAGERCPECRHMSERPW